MTAVEFLAFVRGPAFEIAVIVFLAGVLIRIVEILVLGRARDFSEPRQSGVGSGFRLIVSRFKPESGSLQRSRFVVTAGYVFHIGLFVTIFLFVPHIQLLESVTGLSWPGLPTPIVDIASIITIAALLAILVHRMSNTLLRYLSGFEDYLVWLVTVLPVVTGYLAFHRLLLPYPAMLGLHILSVEVLMVLIPFTKLMHTFTLFLARWYTGSAHGRKGVQS